MKGLNKNKVKLVRIDRNTMEDIRFKLPNMTDRQRIDFVYNNSLIKHQDSINKMGDFIFGKPTWKKIKKR